jgi:hypothetical protein
MPTMPPQVDPETQPLLFHPDRPILDIAAQSTPLPRLQLFIVLFLQLTEPLTSQVIIRLHLRCSLFPDDESFLMLHELVNS